MSEFGERLRKLRKERDITQSQLAEAIGVVPSAVGKYEGTLNAYPSVDVLVKIADYFEVSIDYLLKGVRHLSSVENNISGQMTNSSFIQANQGGIVLSGNSTLHLSPESEELLYIYEALGGRDRIKLLNYALKLERSSAE